MHLSLLSVGLLALPYSILAQDPQSDPYVPKQVKCTDAVVVRPASKGLSADEKAWRKVRLEHVIQSLRTYLPNTNLTGFNVTNYLSRLNSTNAPVVGLAISGGGSQSGIGGLGIWQAFDDRYPPAVAAGTGGLTQCLTYLTGLSGGGFLTVSALASNDFASVEDVRKSSNFSTDYTAGPTGNSTEYYDNFFENAGAKLESGFPVSAVDILGQMWRQYLPPSWAYKSYSDIASVDRAFAKGKAPMPIIALAEVVPGRSPSIGGMLYPGINASNAANLTSYEVTPFEFGSWLGGRVQAFFPTKWLGTPMRQGKPQANDTCVQGFDKFSFIQGSTGNAFNYWFIDAWYNIPLFAKRAVRTLVAKRQIPPPPSSQGGIVIPPDQSDNDLVQLVNETATSFQQTFNDSMWATYPNPFQGYNAKMAGVEELLIVDGSETGETIPLRPLIVPERKLDLIIAYDASLDGKYAYVNGTNFIDSARAASQMGIPFPRVPSSRTMQNLNLTTFPTFFGCNATSGPLVLYLPNYPWSTYSNYSFMQSSISDTQFDLMAENSFNLATYGNGSSRVDGSDGWPACLACGVIKRSLSRVGMQVPDVCTRCFQRHCWNGEDDESVVNEAEQGPVPLLNPSLTYEQWNQTWWGF